MPANRQQSFLSSVYLHWGWGNFPPGDDLKSKYGLGGSVLVRYIEYPIAETVAQILRRNHVYWKFY